MSRFLNLEPVVLNLLVLDMFERYIGRRVLKFLVVRSLGCCQAT